jgi:ABC-type taurine transport system substrate-binding protein
MDRETKLPVKQYAEVIGCHIKTILRAVSGDDHPSDWAPDDEPVNKVARAFGMKPSTLMSVLNKEVKLITTEQAATELGVSIRRFHQMREAGKTPAPAISRGRIVRYFDSDFSL